MCGHADRNHSPGEAVTMPDMALFGMVWLLRMRAEMRRCAKCRREEARWRREESASSAPDAASAPIFTVDSAQLGASVAPHPAPGSYCEVHGFVPRKEGKKVTIYSFKHDMYVSCII